jgi:hypothetical protein
VRARLSARLKWRVSTCGQGHTARTRARQHTRGQRQRRDGCSARRVKRCECGHHALCECACSPQGWPKLAFVVREWQVCAARAAARRVLQADGGTHAAIVLPALSMPPLPEKLRTAAPSAAPANTTRRVTLTRCHAALLWMHPRNPRENRTPPLPPQRPPPFLPTAPEWHPGGAHLRPSSARVLACSLALDGAHAESELLTSNRSNLMPARRAHCLCPVPDPEVELLP